MTIFKTTGVSYVKTFACFYFLGIPALIPWTEQQITSAMECEMGIDMNLNYWKTYMKRTIQKVRMHKFSWKSKKTKNEIHLFTIENVELIFISFEGFYRLRPRFQPTLVPFFILFCKWEPLRKCFEWKIVLKLSRCEKYWK